MIESNPNIMTGKPVVQGTRITVELILEKLEPVVFLVPQTKTPHIRACRLAFGGPIPNAKR